MKTRIRQALPARLLLTDEVRSRFKRIKLRQAMRRPHRPCPDCGGDRLICHQCVRMWCPECHQDCPHHLPATPVVAVSTPIITDTTNGKRSHHKKRMPPTVSIPMDLIVFVQILSQKGYSLEAIRKPTMPKCDHEVVVRSPVEMDFDTDKPIDGWIVQNYSSMRRNKVTEHILSIRKE